MKRILTMATAPPPATPNPNRKETTHIPLPHLPKEKNPNPLRCMHYKEIRTQFTHEFIHFVMNFMKIHYNDFKIGNVKNK
jgi:hypothetical protein